MMWEYENGSYGIPNEVMLEIESHVLSGEKGGFIIGMGIKWSYLEKYNNLITTKNANKNNPQ